MPGFNQTGPAGQGPMTGRGIGICNPSHDRKTNDAIKNAIVGLVSVLIVGLADMLWNKIKEKRLKHELK